MGTNKNGFLESYDSSLSSYITLTLDTTCLSNNKLYVKRSSISSMNYIEHKRTNIIVDGLKYVVEETPEEILKKI